MSYPLSSAVQVGDATEAAQYNNLRMDALYLGNQPGQSGNMLQLLAQSMGAVSLTRISSMIIRLTASPAEPCGLMISGRIYAVIGNVELTISQEETYAAGRYFVYAVGGSDGSFSLAMGSAAPYNGRMVGTFLWDGQGIIPGTVRNKQDYDAVSAVRSPSIVNGRLTLASGTPVTDSDNAGATVYFTPYRGNEIGLNVNGAWEIFSFSELSLSLAGLTNGLPYDVFIEATRNGLQLSAAAWGSASARLTPLAYFEGILVSSADFGRRYLGTLVKNSAGLCEDSMSARLLWNEYNRIPRGLLAQMSAAGPQTAYTGVWAPYNAADCPTITALIPSADAEFTLEGVGLSSLVPQTDAQTGYAYAVGIGQDIVMTAPFTSNTCCVPVFTHSFGNSPVSVRIQNNDVTFRGVHDYSLIFWCNSTYYPRGRELTGCGEHPGLIGYIMG